MFIRKKKNPSGVVSIQVIDKSRGSYKVFKTIGSSSDATEVDNLYQQGKQWLATHCGNREMFREADRQREEKQVTEYLLNNVENILLNGTQLILNEMFCFVAYKVYKELERILNLRGYQSERE